MLKRVEIFVPYGSVPEVTMILHKHDVGGHTIQDVRGRGKAPHTAIPEIVGGEWHQTGKRIVPEYVPRSLVTAAMPEEKVGPIVQDLHKLKVERGKVIVSEITQAYDLVTGQEGDKAL